jgi:hypothetical protein
MDDHAAEVERLPEPPLPGDIEIGGRIHSGREIDREMAADGWRPMTRVTRSRRSHRRRSPITRRTTTRARSSLRSGRPSCSRGNSRASASSGTDPSDDPEPPRAARKARLTYAVLSADERGESIGPSSGFKSVGEIVADFVRDLEGGAA